ncbi:hypothetical protein [Spirosoma sordidisoli]|uniref:Uncharacterized protein n=1 Tax=Spirosoma sordidisoli TaxID=2502893 RepID=A0A4Q2UMG9_9BACT|nr:hypothetical protein [Spirosoma sordidisoli]RYC70827.1 hypothetical protein EQG79_01365 [Spirosoma sordidisoli]
MKNHVITLALYSPSYCPANLQTLCGRYTTDYETKQRASYTIENGVATITALTPIMGTQVTLPLPFCVPVTDLGSGQLHRIDINADTLTAQPATCPSAAWATRRAVMPNPTIRQQVVADQLF